MSKERMKTEPWEAYEKSDRSTPSQYTPSKRIHVTSLTHLCIDPKKNEGVDKPC